MSPTGVLELELDMAKKPKEPKEPKKGSVYTQNIKVKIETHRLAEKVAGTKHVGMSELCDTLLYEALASMWVELLRVEMEEAARQEESVPKRKGGSHGGNQAV